MNTTVKTSEENKKALNASKKQEIYYDENGKRISKTGWAFRQAIERNKGHQPILDMRAVLK